MHVIRNGRTLLSFCSNDYLNLSQHPAVKRAAAAAARTIWRGRRRLAARHRQPPALCASSKQRLARLKGSEAACVFGSGYLANTGIIPALAGPGDLILIDELSHSLHAYRRAD